MYLCRRQNLAEERFRSPLKFYLLLFPLPPLPLRSSVFFNFPFFTFFPQALLTELRLFGYDLKVISLPPRGWVNSPLFHVSREFCFVKLICRNLDALFSHVRNAYIANQNGVQLSFDMEVWSVLTHMASIYANLLEQIKRKHLHKKTVQLPEDWFGTPTWPPFHYFWTPVWPP